MDIVDLAARVEAGHYADDRRVAKVQAMVDGSVKDVPYSIEFACLLMQSCLRMDYETWVRENRT